MLCKTMPATKNRSRKRPHMHSLGSSHAASSLQPCKHARSRNRWPCDHVLSIQTQPISTSPPLLIGPHHRANTFTTPSPPALTTNRPSWLHATQQTPSPLIARWEVISCVQIRFSRDQKRIEASWPAETASLPSFDSEREEMAEGWASIVYVAWPGRMSV